MKATKQDVKSVIFSGCAVEYNSVSICNIEYYLKNAMIKRGGKYQVWSDRHQCYDLYHNIDDAVDKFFKLIESKTNGKL